jgi:hypothetical protein
MNPEIDNLINMALADGEVTEKERAIILRKAESMGLETDEVEMILDGKIALLKKDQNSNQSIPKSVKAGDLKKCPSCGSSVESFNTKCSDCGHEFRNVQAASSISKLYDDLKKAEEEERKKNRNWFENFNGGEAAINLAITNMHKNIISTFPVPNSKEDLLEFLSMASSEAKKKLGFSLYKSLDPPHILKNTWYAKCEQIIMKARFSMKEDKETLDEVEFHAKSLGIK